jgi:hypothetical protein
MYSLFATAFKQLRNTHFAFFNADFHCWRASNRALRFAKVLIRHVKGDCSFKVFQLFAESVCEPGQAANAANVHPQRGVLFLNVRRANAAPIWCANDDQLFSLQS